MKIYVKYFLFALITCLTFPLFAQTDNKSIEYITFKFVPGDDMFYIPWQDNKTELERLFALVDKYRAEIVSGSIPIYVDGYCASLPARKENLNTAFTRANRVKTELILQKGMLEKHFITNNYAEPYKGIKDIVLVTLNISNLEDAWDFEEEDVIGVVEKTSDIPERKEPEPKPEPQREVVPELSESFPARDFPPFAIRTNLLYDAFLTPTLGFEWRINRNIGIKLDGSFAYWGNNHGKVQKMWFISPEVRWYLGDTKRLYVGAGANFGEYNIYKYMIGNIFSKDTGYQGNIYGGGLTVGYQLPICHYFAIDFNLGLGYTRFNHDIFFLSKEVRVYDKRDVTKNFWGPTQAGISLLWLIMK